MGVQADAALTPDHLQQPGRTRSLRRVGREESIQKIDTWIILDKTDIFPAPMSYVFLYSFPRSLWESGQY